MRHFASQMHIVPVDFVVRLERLFTSDRMDVVNQLESLVSDTAALVSQHIPAVDSSGVSKRLSQRHVPRAMKP